MRVRLLSITPGAEKLIEEAGRTAYLSFRRNSKGGHEKFIRMLVGKKHLTVLEHASATFRISGCSRAFTHQLVRHRLCSFTQQSQRYVNETAFDFVEPGSIKIDKKAHLLFVSYIKQAKSIYSRLRKLGIRNEDARFVLPNAVVSEIVVTANLREWRHIIEIRGNVDAQWEIRRVAIAILKLLRQKAPTVFEDFAIDRNNECVKKRVGKYDTT